MNLTIKKKQAGFLRLFFLPLLDCRVDRKAGRRAAKGLRSESNCGCCTDLTILSVCFGFNRILR